MTLSEYAAWYGAAIATFSLLINFIKWHQEKPYKLSVRVSKDKIFMPPQEQDNPAYIHINVVNRGSRSTTITNVEFRHYSSLWRYLSGKPEKCAVVNTHRPGYLNAQIIPCVLESGKVWDGFVRQEKLVDLINKGYLVWRLYFSHSDNPIKVRI